MFETVRRAARMHKYLVLSLMWFAAFAAVVYFAIQLASDVLRA